MTRLSAKGSSAKRLVVRIWYKWACDWLEKARTTQAEKPPGYSLCLDELEAELVRRITAALD